MKVNIAYRFTNAPYGGGNQFLKCLKKYFEERNIYTTSAKEADVVLFNSSNPFYDILKLKAKYPDKVFVHRVDGCFRIYNNSMDKRDYQVYCLNNKVADATVFQSNYSMQENIDMGIPRQQYEKVITNASDNAFFYRKCNESENYLNQNQKKTRILATSFSSNWNKGFKTYQWLDENLDFTKYDMTFIGNSPCTFKNIKVYPPTVSSEIGERLRESDIYISASMIEACSNSIIEALSCGIPVIARNSGSNPELIKKGGLLFEEERDIPTILEKIEKEYSSFQKKISVKSINEVGEEYLRFFETLLKEKNQGNLLTKKVSHIDIFKLYCKGKIDRIKTKRMETKKDLAKDCFCHQKY